MRFHDEGILGEHLQPDHCRRCAEGEGGLLHGQHQVPGGDNQEIQTGVSGYQDCRVFVNILFYYNI